MFSIHIVEGDIASCASLYHLLAQRGFETSVHNGFTELLLAPIREEGCILLDLRLAEPDFRAVRAKLRAVDCAMPIILLAGQEHVRDGITALKQGAADLLVRPIDASQLVSAIEGALDEARWVRSRNDARAFSAARIADLSQREIQILRGILAGMTNKHMARCLSISPRTIEMHRANLMADLQLKSAADAIRLAVDAELAPLDGEHEHERADPLIVPAAHAPRARPPAHPMMPVREPMPTAWDLLEATTDGFLILDVNDRLVYLNGNVRKAIAGGRDLRGRCIWDEFPLAKGTRAFTELRRAAEGRKSAPFAFYEPNLKRWLDVRISPIRHGLLVGLRERRRGGRRLPR